MRRFCLTAGLRALGLCLTLAVPQWAWAAGPQAPLDLAAVLPWRVDAAALGAPGLRAQAAADAPALTLRLLPSQAAAVGPPAAALQANLGDTAFSMDFLRDAGLEGARYSSMRTFTGLHDGEEVEIYTLLARPPRYALHHAAAAAPRWLKVDVEVRVQDHKVREMRFFDASFVVARRLVCGAATLPAALGSCTLYSELPQEPPESHLTWYAPSARHHAGLPRATAPHPRIARAHP